jgi:hypothetical protein
MVVFQDQGILDLDDERNDGMPPKDEEIKYTLREAKAMAICELRETLDNLISPSQMDDFLSR